MKLSVSLNYSDIFPKERMFKERLLRGEIFKSSYRPRQLFESWPIRNVELVIPPNFTLNKIHSIREIIKDYNLVALSVHQSISRIDHLPFEQMENLFRITQIFSAKLAIAHLTALGRHIFNPKFVEEFKDLEDKYQTKMAFENGTKNIFTWLRPHTWKGEEFAKVLGTAGLGITMDTSHLAQSGGDILEFYKNHQKQILNIHFSDFGGSLLKTHLPLGKGKLPVREFLCLLIATRYQGLLTLEIAGELKGVLDSIDLVESYLKS